MMNLESVYIHDNYKIILGSGKITFIFISSNGLYSNNNTKKAMEILNKDHFEWENICKSKIILKKAKKIIFLRDIYKHSYVDGINKKINTLPKVIEFVRKLTKEDEEIYLIGNSGGGYLSFLLSSYLNNCKKVFSFGGVVSLYEWTGSHDDYKFNDATHLIKHLNNLSNYFDTRSFIKNSKCQIFHFWSCGNNPDKIQFDLLKEINLKNLTAFGFRSTVHGKTVNSFDYEKLFTCDNVHLNKLKKRFGNKINISKNLFSLYNLGCIKYLFCLIKRVFRKLKRLLKHGV